MKKLSTVQKQSRKPKKDSAGTKRRIPPPPGADAATEEQAAYFDKYGMVDLEEAGYLKAPSLADKKLQKELRESAKAHLAKDKREQLNLSLKPDDLERLQKAAKRQHLLPTTLAKAWILECLDRGGPAR